MADAIDDADRATAHTLRRERSHVEFPDATWTSFDRYARYGAIVRAIRASLGTAALTVADVGDASGYLLAFAPEWTSIGIDLQFGTDHLAGSRLVVGDGTRLPVRDRAADAVVSSDALEHVPSASRESFVRELARAARELVVIAAPFDTPGVAGAEELARRHAALATGHPQAQLDEHAEHGLPSIEETMAVLRDEGLNVAVQGNGNLSDWLVFMMLKHQIAARPALLPLDTGYDLAYNLLLAGRGATPPFYRHVIVAARTVALEFGDAMSSVDETVDPTPLLAALVGLTSTEVVRQDTHGEVERVRVEVETLAPRLLALETKVAELGEAIEHLADALRHPLRSLGNRVRRTNDES